MGTTKKRVKKRKPKCNSIGGKGTTGALKGFHRPKGDLTVRQRAKYQPERKDQWDPID